MHSLRPARRANGLKTVSVDRARVRPSSFLPPTKSPVHFFSIPRARTCCVYVWCRPDFSCATFESIHPSLCRPWSTFPNRVETARVENKMQGRSSCLRFNHPVGCHGQSSSRPSRLRPHVSSSPISYERRRSFGAALRCVNKGYECPRFVGKNCDI